MFVLSGCELLLLAGASDAEPGPGEGDSTMAQVSGGDQFPDVLAVELRPKGEGIFDVAVTLSSPYDTAQRYADGWRVLDADGNVLGSHTLLHDHAAEQPFTRTQSGLVIPDGVAEITVQGRDQANGFGGLTLTVPIPQP